MKIGPLFQFAAWNIGAGTEWSGPKTGERERSGERVWKKIVWSGRSRRGERSGHRKSQKLFERQAEILPLPLRSHDLFFSPVCCLWYWSHYLPWSSDFLVRL